MTGAQLSVGELSLNGFREGLPGARSRCNTLDRFFSGAWSGGSAFNVQTITTGSATDSTTYTLTVTYGSEAARSVSFTTGVSTTTALLSAGLLAALLADPILNGNITFAAGSATTITATGRTKGVTIVITSSSGQVTIAQTTAASDGSNLDFARLVAIASRGVAGVPNIASLASTLTAQVDTMTIAYAASTIYTVAIRFRGSLYVAQTTANTDTATTLAALVAAINATMPALSVIAASVGAGVFSLAAEVPGDPFTTTPNVEAGAGTLTVSSAAPLSSDVNKVIAGLSLRSFVEAQLASSTATAYVPNSTVPLLGQGAAWIDNAEGITDGCLLYVTTATGKITKTPAAGTPLLVGARGIRQGVIDPNIAEVYLPFNNV